MDVMGVKFAPVNVPLNRRLQTLAAATWIITLVAGGYIGQFLMFYILVFTRFWWAGLLYLGWIYLDRHTAEHGGRPIKWVRNWSWWTYLRDYFPIRLEKTEDAILDSKKNYLLCFYPHGLLCTGAFGSFATDACGWWKLYPDLRPYLLTLGQHFNKPFFRELVLGLGTCSSSAESINNIFDGPETGKAVVLAVGGAAESLCSRPGEYHVVLNRRKGFVRIALKNGTPLVPVFSFGEPDLFSQVENPEGSFLRKLQDILRRLTGIAPVLFFGRGLFQYSFGLVPRRLPVTVVVGPPLEVEKIEEPTKEQIDELHTKFRQHLLDFFNREKHKYLQNAEQRELVIE